MLNWFKTKIRKVSVPVISDAQAGSPVLPDSRELKRQGDEYSKAGRYTDAERLYRRIERSDAQYPDALVMLGFVLKEQNRTSEARDVLQQAVQIAIDNADAHYLLATVLEKIGPRASEIFHLQKAVNLRADFEFANRQLIVALLKEDRRGDATEVCEASLKRCPCSAALHLCRSNLYLQAGDKTSAIASMRQALELDPAAAEVQRSLSRLLFDNEQFEQAELSYRREIEMTPNHFGPYHMLGVVLNRLARHAEAIAVFKRALELNCDSSASYSSLAASYIDLDDTSAENLALAQANYEKAVELSPENSEFHCNLGFNYWRTVQIGRALASFDQAIAKDPKNSKARWARVMLWAPAFSADGVNDSLDRSGFGKELTHFKNWWVNSDSDGAAFVGELQPFFLTYQEENNVELLKRYGSVCSEAMRRWLDRQKPPAFKRPLESRVRLGIVSADIRLHSVWIAIIKGWLQSLDPKRFELVIFSLTAQPDSETSWAQAQSDVFVSGLKTLSHTVSVIREQNCEILLYPAVGLDPFTLKLASLRLAPVQINTWGHPDTSGLPTLDYYVSAECFEHAKAQDHYSEQLVQLPHLGNRIQPFNLSDSDPGFAAMNIDFSRPVLVCPGTPYKYQTEHDHIFVDIARRAPHAQFIFFMRAGAALGKVLRDRLTREFEVAGLDVTKHVRFLQWLHFPEFHCLLRRAHVLLDTIGFSGYNTAVQAMECGLPIVTREGNFLRGRLASGVLRRMGLEELIVATKQEYVELVLRLITDGSFVERIRQDIVRRNSVLFDDRSAMGPFQDWLESIARREGVVLAPNV